MQFSSHSCVSAKTIHGTAAVEASGLMPALNGLLQAATGMGIALDSQAVNRAYDALVAFGHHINLEDDLSTVFGFGHGFTHFVKTVTGQDIAPLLAAGTGGDNLLRSAGEVHAQATNLLQSWHGTQGVDPLTGASLKSGLINGQCSDSTLQPQGATPDLQQYWFYYSFNPANPETADSYIGSVIAPEGTYQLAPQLPGGRGYDPAYGFNPKAQLTEASADGQYLIYGKSDYDDALVADEGKVFVFSYTDRVGSEATRVTPSQYAQGGKPSGLNFLGSELDYLGSGRTAAAWFGQDHYEADTANPDLDIQVNTPFGYFSAAQRSAIETAVTNWEQLIVSDKDESGILNLAFTHSAQRIDGSSWGWVWGEAYIDQWVGQRQDRDYAVVDIGGDFHNRINYNSLKLSQLSSHQLIRLTMHEIGHALGLDEAQEDALLGLDSVMDKHGLDPQVTEGMFQRLESLGYKVNRAAANGVQWDVPAVAIA